MSYFKQTYGFDVESFRFGRPIIVYDNELSERPMGHFRTRLDTDGLDYDWENKSGTYLVKESSSTMLRLTNVEGKEVKLPIRHFIAEEDKEPRMRLQVHMGWV